MVVAYFAGRIAKNDWRHSLVPGLRGELTPGDIGRYALPAVLAIPDSSIRYGGPFFVSDDHGCAHSPNSHGACAFGCQEGLVPWTLREQQSEVYWRCEREIRRADHVFAWIEDLEAFGTLVEIGLARALGKRITLYTKTSKTFEDLWFAHAAVGVGNIYQSGDALAAAQEFIFRLDVGAQPVQSLV